MKATINIESVLSTKNSSGNGQWAISTCLVTADFQNKNYAEKVKILHKPGELTPGHLDESVSVNISLRRGNGDYPASLSIVLVGRLKKTYA